MTIVHVDGGKRDQRAALAAHFAQHLPQARELELVNMRRASGGMSRSNWLTDITYRNLYGRRVEQRFVVRRDEGGGPVPVPVAREYATLRALEGNGVVPTPKTFWLEPRDTVLGAPFFVMGFCEGHYDRRVLIDDRLPMPDRVALAKEYARMLAAIHQLDANALGFDGVPRLEEEPARAALDNCLEQLGDYVRQNPVLAWAVDWLQTNVPCGQSDLALVHGDFRPANCLTLGAKISAVLDWELAHLSDPYEDIANYMLPNMYEIEHFIAGHYDPRDFLEDYATASGRRIDADRLLYWQVLNAMKLVAYDVNAYSADAERRILSRPWVWQVPREQLIGTLLGLC